jgi:hypothetical protein
MLFISFYLTNWAVMNVPYVYKWLLCIQANWYWIIFFCVEKYFFWYRGAMNRKVLSYYFISRISEFKKFLLLLLLFTSLYQLWLFKTKYIHIWKYLSTNSLTLKRQPRVLYVLIKLNHCLKPFIANKSKFLYLLVSVFPYFLFPSFIQPSGGICGLLFIASRVFCYQI